MRAGAAATTAGSQGASSSALGPGGGGGAGSGLEAQGQAGEEATWGAGRWSGRRGELTGRVGWLRGGLDSSEAECSVGTGSRRDLGEGQLEGRGPNWGLAMSEVNGAGTGGQGGSTPCSDPERLLGQGAPSRAGCPRAGRANFGMGITP